MLDNNPRPPSSAENDQTALSGVQVTSMGKMAEIVEARHGKEEPITATDLPTGIDSSPPAISLPQDETNGPVEQTHRGVQFWAIIAALCMTSMLASLENTVVATSLPTIVETLNIGHNYIWVTNVFFLTSAAVQPFFGQVANIFGRRWLAISIVVTFTVGSAICGGASNGGTLIAGRAIQGIGSGGINMIVDIIVSDLVPLRERGNFIAIILAVYSVGTSLGPFLGGIIVEKTSWRWVFLITLPFGGLSIILLFLFLHVNSKRLTMREGFKRIDVVGNTIIIASSISILFALNYSGSPYSWSSWHILVPLILGFCGYAAFIVWEGSKFCPDPVIPLRLFNNRTSVVVYINTFINSMLLYWVMFFLPVYFQVALGSSPARSGVQLLPIILVAVPGAVIAVIVLSKFGKYKLLHLVGFAIATLGTGLFILLDQHSSTAKWVVFQVVAGLGSGMVLNTLLPAFQASHPETDQAAATASWAFIRSFGNIWGVATPAAIFNNRIDNILYRITDEAIRQAIASGQAYELGPSILKATSSPVLRDEISGVYADALKIVWAVAAGFGGLAFLLVFVEAEVPLRKELETDYSLKEKAAV